MNNNESNNENNKISLPIIIFLVLFMLGTSLFSLFIYHKFYRKSDSPSQPASTVVTDEYGRININDATYSDLLLVDGIGKEIANDILEFRESYGIITDINVLAEIENIGDAKLEALKRHFYCYNVPSDMTTKATITEPTNSVCETTSVTTPLSTDTSLSTTTTKTNTTKPTISTTKKPTSTTTITVERSRKPVNINTATADEISENLLIDIEIANEIVKLREQIGGYSNTLEILYCDSVTDALYLELEEFLNI